MAWFSANKFEFDAFMMRIFDGPKTPYYYAMMSCNVLAPQLFWFRWCRQNLWVVMFVSMCVNFGMWYERYVIIVTTLPRMWLPGDWGSFNATWVDWITFLGTIGLFLALFLLFLRFLPCINIAEVKWTLPNAHAHKDPIQKDMTGRVTEPEVLGTAGTTQAAESEPNQPQPIGT